MLEALRDITDELIAALGPLVDAAQDPEELKALLADLGWTPNSVPQPLLELAQAGSELVGAIGSDPEGISPTQAIDSVKRLVDAINAIRTKPDEAFPSGIDIASFKATIGRDLIDYVLVEHLLRNRHKIGGLLKLAGLIRLVETPATGLRQSYLKREVVWSRIGNLLTDPAQGFREVFDWNSATPKLTQALADLASLLESYDLQLSYFEPTGDLLTFVNAGATVPLDEPLGIDLAFGDTLDAPDGFAAGVHLLILPPTASRGAAIAFLPYAQLSGAQEVALSDDLFLSIGGNADFTKGIAIIIAPGHPPEVHAGFLGGMAVSPAEIQIGLKVTVPPDAPERRLIGAPNATRLTIQTVGFFVGARLVSSDKLDTYAAIELENARVVIKPAPGEADSFVASLLGEDGISAGLSFGLRLSSLAGFHLTGSSGLEASFPLHSTLGPIGFQALSVGLKPSEQGVELEAGATVSGKLGPITVVVDRVGFKLTVRFPDPPTGNLGPVDLALGFKPPDGIGLVIDAGSVVGGGFLFFDPAQDQYAGAVQLESNNITLQGIGLITTRLPGGASGFSMLVIITAEGFTPINLGLGFTLNGVGGLLAVHRTVAVEPLRLGLKQHTLDAVLFPTDPVANAPQIISNLRQLFPVKPDQFAFGPMAIIRWLNVLTIELALVLEFPSPFRLIALGQFRALLPSRDQPLVRLNMDALGVVDFDRGELAVDATLYDSRILDYSVSGDMALRARWNDDPTFLLAVGGFHPRFQPPPGFPTLDRVAINLTKGNNPRLRLTAYLALTSNTAQIGARLDLFAAVGRASVEGHLSFDALLQFAPFQFVVDLGAAVTFKYRGRTLLGVSLEMTLSGPAPWHARGKATIDLWLFSVSVSFDEAFGDAAPTTLPPVDPLPELLQALGDRHNWSAQLPKTRAMLVTLREIPATDEVLVHPLSRLSVRQRVLPLNVEISRFGNATPRGERRFTITHVTLNKTPVEEEARVPTRDFFARAQFMEMSDAQKLTAPSFDKMDAGVELEVAPVAYGGQTDANLMVTTKIEYEECLIGDDADTWAVKPYDVTPETLAAVASMSAAGRSPMRHTGREKYRAPALTVAFEPVTYVVARTTDLAVTTIPELDGAVQGATYTAAHDALARHLARHPEERDRLQVVPHNEAKGGVG